MNYKKNNIMFDLETLGDDFIVQVGAVYFNWDGEIRDKFLMNVSLADCEQKGFKIQVGALKFWLERSNLITWLKNGQTITKTLSHFKNFCDKNKKALIWSHYYDIMVLENVSKKLGQKLPFSYKRWRDIRTLVSLSGYKHKKEVKGDAKNHNALDDCLFQVDYLVKAFKFGGFKW